MTKHWTPLAFIYLALAACGLVGTWIFNGLAISLIFGILVSTVLTLVVIPVLYYAANWKRWGSRPASTEAASPAPAAGPDQAA